MTYKRYLGAPLAVLLAAIMATGVSLAPTASAATPTATATTSTMTPVPATSATVPATSTAPAPTTAATAPAPTTAAPAPSTSTPTVTPTIKATLSITPTTANRGGLVTVSGAGFAANETVLIYFTQTPKTTTSAKADAKGNLPATGVTVPYDITPGKHSLNALGTTSKRSVTKTIVIQALTPSITLSATSASPNNTITVTGKGFGSKEQITLSLNGAAVTTKPSPITTTNGAFTATFVVPTRLLNGANTVSAIGNESRVSAVAALTGTLPVATQFYFAGGINTATEHSSIDLLNSNGEPVTAHLTFYFSNGATDTKTVSVNPTSEKVITVESLESTSGPFGLAIQADRQIAAQINISRLSQDGDSLLGNTGLGTKWYLAEGYTGLTFHENVSILNPSTTAAAHVLLHLLPFGGLPSKDVPVIVPPHTNYVADINSQMPKRSLSIIATSDQPVVVERTLTFSNNGFGMTSRAGTNAPATSWIFAEGTTTTRFQTFLTILNPNPLAALVTASFFSSTGASLGSKTVVVSGLSRANIKLNDFLHASGIASVVTSDQPIVVERPEYFGSPNDPNIAGSDVFGRNGAGVRWSFPGGNTQSTNEYLLLYNPSAVTVPIQATFYGSDGKTIVKPLSVAPGVRDTVNINALIPGFAGLHGAVLQSTNKQGFVAEQTVFAANFTSLRSTQGLAQ